MEFDLPKGQSSIIKVIGVGGGGSNAVNHMYNMGIKGVDFVVCNTDCQSLDISPVPLKIQLGPGLTEGRGAGSIPEIGKNAAIENIEEITEILSKNTKMVFVTAGMGGGTGTGAAPVIAKIAKEMGILTVGIVTVPFNFEGRKRRQQAENGLEEMRRNVDTLLVINNERLREMYGNLTLGNAFAQADDVLTTAAKGIAEVISVTGAINVDFNDVNTVMKDSGVAIMGSAVADGENRAIEAVQRALTSPLLNDNDISGAKYVLLNITYGDKEVLMDEIADITDYIQDEAGSTADVIWGHAYDETLGEGICVTLIATGFNVSPVTGFERAPEKMVRKLEEEQRNEVKAPLTSPLEASTSSVANESSVNEVEEMPFLKSVEASVSTEEFTAETNSFESAIELEVPQSTMNFDWEIKAEESEAVRFTLEEEESVEFSSEVEVTPFVSETSQEVEEEKVTRYVLEDDLEEKVTSSPVSEHTLSPEEQQRKAEERMARIRTYTSKLKKPDGISELEQQPAFMRRNIQLEDTPHSSESSASRFGLFTNEEDGKAGLRGNNSFLHDNVD
jgi:cell division protein FtsZ